LKPGAVKRVCVCVCGAELHIFSAIVNLSEPHRRSSTPAGWRRSPRSSPPTAGWAGAAGSRTAGASCGTGSRTARLLVCWWWRWGDGQWMSGGRHMVRVEEVACVGVCLTQSGKGRGARITPHTHAVGLCASSLSQATVRGVKDAWSSRPGGRGDGEEGRYMLGEMTCFGFFEVR
jgi:hypothetical protein